ncbi:nuclear factor of activated T-cells, cytoplasmic 3-like, partial [Nematolebias whitei]|uniref:nuclear factor of activated T-cells, cytoplasmic 3-like n=1 Tax=Nematolebias whitei TaxID=451745 RepID=UPI00189808FB
PSSPPPLDWPLPNQWNQTELKVEVQPKSYHRAHYETEGSRGSIKAATGGHPVVRLSGCSEQPLSLLLFIGTSDDQYPRPHSFYQVHKVTGKTVTTICQEKVMGSTKVLDVPLLPENNMSVSINCAGILKLRNADIELKKGETDIGRKNTRVRVVFRAAVPQQDGRTLWLQTASVPIECSQRSGLELPHVESFCPTSCSMEGEVELLISGSNMAAHSRVVFVEKGSDGRSLWETDARVLSEKSNDSRVAVVVPPYTKKAASPVHVQFYVSNGKRRRSPAQSFTFLPGPHYAAGVEQEHWGADHLLYQPLSQDGTLGASYDPCARLPHPASSSLPLQAHAQDSGSPVQILSAPCSMSFGGQLREPSLGSSTPFTAPASAPGELLRLKQEPEEQPHLGSLGLQEITLDDVNEIIDRDIGGLSSSAGPDQFHQYNWDHESSAQSFCRDFE